jgi:hypothetical protein
VNASAADSPVNGPTTLLLALSLKSVPLKAARRNSSTGFAPIHAYCSHRLARRGLHLGISIRTESAAPEDEIGARYYGFECVRVY